MPVSGEFRYFGPAFSSVARVRPVNAMILPASLVMGNITRLRNLEYMAAAGFRLSASGVGVESKSPPLRLCSGLACPSKERTDEDGAASLLSDLLVRLSSCFQENRPLSRSTSSLKSLARRSRSRKPESG